MSPPRRPERRRLLVLVSAASLGFLAALPQAFDAPRAVAGTLPVEAALPAQGATLTASTLVLSGLVYNGVATVATTAGNVDTLELTSTSATLTGLKLDVPCQPLSSGLGGMTFSAVTPNDSTSTAANGVRLYATSVTGTMAGNTVTWTPTNPPGGATGTSTGTSPAGSPAAAAAAKQTPSPSPSPTGPPSPSPTGSPSASPSPADSPSAARMVQPSPSPSPSASPTPQRTPSARSGSRSASRAVSPAAAATTATAVQLGDVTLAEATINLAVLQAPSLRMPGLLQTTSFCQP